MNRLLSAVVALVVLPIAVTVPASAAPATHHTIVEQHDASEPFAAGEREPCVPRAGTFHEVRSEPR